MAYLLDPARSTAEEVRRVLGEQLDSAVLDLTATPEPDAEAVHDARKRLKKARSVIRLARNDLGAGVARQANAELRDAGRALSARRDADAMVETIDRLLVAATGDPHAVDAFDAVDALTALRSELGGVGPIVDTPSGGEGIDAEQPGRTDRLATIAVAVAGTSRWLADVPHRSSGWEALAPGVRRRYAQGRAALTALGPDPTDEALHDWRKRAKDLWYHLRLLERCWPPVLEPLADEAGRLADLLGDDHDLAVLTTHLRPQGSDGRGAPGATAVLALIADERARLQDRARRLGSRVYVDRPAVWTGRLGAWWSAVSTER